MSGNIDLNTPIAVNLPLGAWNTVLGLIAKGPWEVSDPLMQVMRAQIQASQAKMQQAPNITRMVSDREAS